MRGLIELIEGEHGQALEYTLIELGLRLRWLGTELLTWRDLLVVVKHSPLSSALARSIRGEAAEFGMTEYLLSGVFNTLAGISWQLAGDPKAKKPTPYIPPGQKVPDEGLRMRGDLMSIEDMDRRLAPYKPR